MNERTALTSGLDGFFATRCHGQRYLVPDTPDTRTRTEACTMTEAAAPFESHGDDLARLRSAE